MLHRDANRGGARFWFCCLCVGLGFGIVSACPATAAPPENSAAKKKLRLDDKLQTLTKGSSSEEAQQQGLAELPLDKLTPAGRQKAAGILESLSLFRELPVTALQAEPEVHRYFLDHPEMAVSIWRAMKISQFEMWQTGREEYEADAGDGSTGVVTVLYLGGPHCVVLCDGVYKSPFLAKPIKATALLHVETVYLQRADGKTYVRHGGHLYVSFPSQTVDTAAKRVPHCEL